MVTDVNHVTTRSYVHWNNIKNHPYNFRAQGPKKVCIHMNKYEDMVVGSPTIVYAKKIYYTQPEISWVNYFYHNMIFYYAGNKGFGLIMTVRHDRPTKGVPTKYIHKYGTQGIIKFTKVLAD